MVSALMTYIFVASFAVLRAVKAFFVEAVEKVTAVADADFVLEPPVLLALKALVLVAFLTALLAFLANLVVGIIIKGTILQTALFVQASLEAFLADVLGAH